MAYTEFYIQPTGSNLNAGSTNLDAPAFTYASGSWVAGTGVFTVASGNPLSDGVAVGNFASVYADGSTVTGFVGRVTARDATTITVSLTAKSGTAPVDGTSNRTLKVGGAWKGPNGAEGFPFGFIQSTMTNVAGDAPRANFKAGTYSITAAMTHANSGPIRLEGYNSTPGDGGMFTIDGGTVSAFTLLTLSGGNCDLLNAIFRTSSTTGGAAAAITITGVESFLRRVVVNNVRGHGINVTGPNVRLVECEVYACNTSNSGGIGGIHVTGGSVALRCISHDNPTSNTLGFKVNGDATIINCISESNGLVGMEIASAAGAFLVGCDFYNNGSSGIVMTNSGATLNYIENCNFIKNGAWGINGTSAFPRSGAIVNCGFGAGAQANTSGTMTGLSSMVEIGSVIYPANVTPWNNPANGDFRIVLGEAKGTGRGVFTQTAPSYTGTVAYPDLGGAQGTSAGMTEMAADIAAIKAKTDNLPTDPADASDIAASFAVVNAEMAAVKAKTDALPPDPADASDIAASFDIVTSEVAAIKAKTNNLPPDPADASDIAASLGGLNSEVVAIRAKTDLLPADPADASDIATAIDGVNIEIGAVRLQTDQLRFIEGDVVSTLDGEPVTIASGGGGPSPMPPFPYPGGGSLRMEFEPDVDSTFINRLEFAKRYKFKITEAGVEKEFEADVVWDDEVLKTRLVVQQQGVYLGDVLCYFPCRYFAVKPKVEQIIWRWWTPEEQYPVNVGASYWEGWRVLNVVDAEFCYDLYLDKLIA